MEAMLFRMGPRRAHDAQHHEERALGNRGAGEEWDDDNCRTPLPATANASWQDAGSGTRCPPYNGSRR